MEISINKIHNYTKKEQTLIIKDSGICLIEGNSCYEKVLNDDYEFIKDVEGRLAKIMFSWKDEYIGNRSVDGEKYHIVVDINHKKKKYKIQNRFPENWDQFLELQEMIVGGNDYD